MKFYLALVTLIFSSMLSETRAADKTDVAQCIANQMTVSMNVGDRSSKEDLLRALEVIGDSGIARPVVITTSSSSRILAISFSSRVSVRAVRTLFEGLNQINGVSAICKLQGGPLDGAVSGNN